MDIYAVINLFSALDDDEVLRIELINGTTIYCLPRDDVYIDRALSLEIRKPPLEIRKPIKNGVNQRIRIDEDAIVVICTMSRETYDLKLQRGELYV